MDDPIEARLRAMLREPETGHEQQLSSAADHRLERVLHKAHVQGGLLDLLNLFARWGWVLGEGVARGLPHRQPQRRTPGSTHDQTASE